MYGILSIFLAGALLHFAFDLSGGLRPLALIAAVNESVWEHLKIGFWPAFVWTVIEFFVFGKRTRNFLFAKGVAFTGQSLLITGIYYAAVSAGIENLAVDITNFFVSIAVAQIVSYRLNLVQKRSAALRITGVLLVIINLAGFSMLTYFAPQCPVFKDPVSGGYGIAGLVD